MLVMGLAPSIWMPTIENRIGTPAVIRPETTRPDLRGMNVLPDSGLSVSANEEGRQ
jgi:hypothetical protein